MNERMKIYRPMSRNRCQTKQKKMIQKQKNMNSELQKLFVAVSFHSDTKAFLPKVLLELMLNRRE